VTTTDMGLRERKKLATREALSHAAFRLFREHGIEAVTPEAVAEAVGVSPRTFRNYFGCREEAVVDAFTLRAQAMAEALRARPAAEPVWESLLAVLPGEFTEIVGNRADISALKCESMKNPAIFAQNLAAFERVHQLMALTIAERTGLDAERDLEPQLLAASVGVALRTSVDVWIARDDTGTTLPELVVEALVKLREGLPFANAAGRGP
jgi:AcrR family transcriptional regulator